MKQFLRSRVSKLSSYIEIYISVIILLGIVLVSFSLFKDLYLIIKELINGSDTFMIEAFLGHTLQLIIGVEFVKMLAKHTPGSVIEVLLFAIARKLIVDHSSSMDLLIGVVAIAILFFIKKFLYSTNFTQEEGIVVSGGTAIRQVNKIASANIPETLGNTVGGVIANDLNSKGRKLVAGTSIVTGDVVLKIFSMRDGLIDKVEVIPRDPSKAKL